MAATFSLITAGTLNGISMLSFQEIFIEVGYFIFWRSEFAAKIRGTSVVY